MKTCIFVLLFIPTLLLARVDTVYVHYYYHDDQFCAELTAFANDYFLQYGIVFMRSDKFVAEHLNLTVTIDSCTDSTLIEKFTTFNNDDKSRQNIIICNSGPYYKKMFLHKIGHAFGWDHFYYINDKLIKLSKRYLMNPEGESIHMCPYHNQWMRSYKAMFFDALKESKNKP